MSNVKVIAVHAIQVPNGTKARDKRIDGRVVIEGSTGKPVVEQVAVIATIQPGAVFVMDNASDDYAKLKRLGSIRDTDADAKVTFSLASEEPAAPAKAKGKAPKAPKAAEAPAPTDGDDEGVI